MNEKSDKVTEANPIDPTKNVRELVDMAIKRIDDLADAREKQINEKIRDKDTQYQLQFTSAKEAVAIASTAQEKAMAAALEGTKDAISKADTNTDKRFSLLSEKIDGITTTMNKSTGERGIYVTHGDLSVVVEKIQTSFENALKPLVSQVNILTNAQNSTQGRSSGLNAGWGYLIQAVGFIAVIISIFFALNK